MSEVSESSRCGLQEMLDHAQGKIELRSEIVADPFYAQNDVESLKEHKPVEVEDG